LRSRPKGADKLSGNLSACNDSDLEDWAEHVRSLPSYFRLHLFRDCQGVVNIDPEIRTLLSILV